MKAFKVPIKVTMWGWAKINAEGLNEAVLVAEHMKGHTMIRPNWDSVLKDRQESYIVETAKVEELEDREEALEPA